MIQADISSSIWTRTIDRAGITLVEDALQVEAQGVTCYSSTSLTLYSVLAQALIERGGPSIRAEAAKHRDVRVGDVVALPGGKLKSTYVLAAVTNAPRDTPTLDSIATCVAEVLRRATSLGLVSLAIPLLRVGRHLEPEAILRATMTAVIDCLCGSTSLCQVYIGLQDHLSPVSNQGLTHYLDDSFEGFVALGALRARIAGLQEIVQRLTLFEQSSPRLKAMITRAELGLQLQVKDLLEQEQGRHPHGAAGLALELRRCVELIGAIERVQGRPAMHLPRERAIGE